MRDDGPQVARPVHGADPAGRDQGWHKASLRFLKPFAAKFGHREPTTLKAREVEWLDGEDDWCGSTQAGFVVTVKAARNWAVAEDYLKESPLTKLRRRKIARRERLLTADELKGVLDRASPRLPRLPDRVGLD